MQFKLLLFDFDGTIADTLHHAHAILNVLAEEYGFNSLPKSELERAKGMSAGQLIRFLRIPKRKIPILLGKGKKMLRANLNEIPVCNGMDAMLKQLHEEGWRMGILTSNSVENVEAFLKDKDLDYFEFVSSVGGISGKHKYMRAILRTFSLRPESMLYVGDETRDVKASKKVRVPVAACCWGFNNEVALSAFKPEFLVKDPVELIDVVHAEGVEPPV